MDSDRHFGEESVFGVAVSGGECEEGRVWNRLKAVDVRRGESQSPSQVLRIGEDQNISIVSGDRLSGY